MRADQGWVVAFDDFLTQRITTCFLCGRPAQYLDVFNTPTRAWCVGRCARCRDADPACRELAAALAAREAR